MKTPVVTMQEYRDANGNSIIITSVNGVATTEIPEGYTLYTPPANTAPTTTQAAIQTVNINSYRPSGDNEGPEPQPDQPAPDYRNMNDDEFFSYMAEQNGFGAKAGNAAGLAIATMIGGPVGLLVSALMRNDKNNQMANMKSRIDRMPNGPAKTNALAAYKEYGGETDPKKKQGLFANITNFVTGLVTPVANALGINQEDAAKVAQNAAVTEVSGTAAYDEKVKQARANIISPAQSVTPTAGQISSQFGPNYTGPPPSAPFNTQTGGGVGPVTNLGSPIPGEKDLTNYLTISGYNPTSSLGLDPAPTTEQTDSRRAIPTGRGINMEVPAYDAPGSIGYKSSPLIDAPSIKPLPIEPIAQAGVLDDMIARAPDRTSAFDTSRPAVQVAKGQRTNRVKDGSFGQIFDSITGQRSVEELRDQGKIAAQGILEEQALKESPDMFGPVAQPSAVTQQAPVAQPPAVTQQAPVADFATPMDTPTYGISLKRSPTDFQYAEPDPRDNVNLTGTGVDAQMTAAIPPQQGLISKQMEGMGSPLSPVTSPIGLNVEPRARSMYEYPVQETAPKETPAQARAIEAAAQRARIQTRNKEIATATSKIPAYIANSKQTQDSIKAGYVGSTTGGYAIGKISGSDGNEAGVVQRADGKVTKLRDLEGYEGLKGTQRGAMTVFSDAEGTKFVKSTFGKKTKLNGDKYEGPGITQADKDGKSGSTGSERGGSSSGRTVAEIQADINKEVGGGKAWTSKANDLVAEREAAKKASSGGGGDGGGSSSSTTSSSSNKQSGTGFFRGADESGNTGSDSSKGGYSCYVATALSEKGYWSHTQKIKLIKWCIEAKPEGKLDTVLWRNGYCIFGKNIIAPKVDNKIIQWLSNGFYHATINNKKTLQAILGKLFFIIPSYTIGICKALRGSLVDIERT